MRVIRPAMSDDAAAMSYIHSRTWKAAYKEFISQEYLDNITDEGWIQIFKRSIVKNIHEVAVFELNNRITGCITYGRGRIGQTCAMSDSVVSDNSSCSGENSGEIISLYVLPEYWNSKQGYELTRFAVERLRQQGFKDCYLWVIKDNERAKKFYRRFGFNSTKTFAAVNLGGRDIVEEKFNYILI
ncbi:GNAT family N-acetyltransferase [Ruminiclostridium cellulolyticum]|uniref:GCN5-related N-acetyltransferase n=1 Tax=Ruminiclostridium cellulolyticum (strain ATCC 35319 / DSM 5812 / JCM 6584 / H10) TaxID=394503 RepID=B8I2Q8_RUMCH|nr:GNAT family N-acetyltransferase [Ruminiclostridium cellulolyticum]ACL76051.1 GCN5-related N-acetyltransferase [Ruminiclostridium cellulolyticum H10]